MTGLARLTYWWTLVAVMIPNVALSITEPMSLLQSAANIVLPFGAYWWLMSLTRRVGLSVWLMLPLFLLAAFQLVLLSLYGRGVIAVDMYLNVVTTNSSEAGELLAGMLPALAGVVAVYLPPLVSGAVLIVRKGMITEQMKRLCLRVSGLMVALGMILTIMCVVSPKPYSVLRDLYPVNAFYNLILSMERYGAQKGYPASATDFHFDAVATDTVPSITVIVVGETSRADNWQLYGYERSTNPRLARREGLVTFRRSLSQSNTTHKSVPLMLSHLTASEFGDSIFHVRSIITAFREAGIRTAFVSNQERAGAMIDAFGSEADTTIFLADRLQHRRTDLLLLPVVDSLLAAIPAGENALLVIHTYGSHFNYDDRYPAAMAAFRPDGPLEAEASKRPVLVNAYDNTIRLTDLFLDSLISRLEANTTAASLIYTSDHGEDIFDDTRHLFLHASPVPSYHQLRVPLLLWMSRSYRRAYPGRFLTAEANASRPVATSASVSHTAMMLGGISTDRLMPSLSLVSNSYTPPPYRYLDDHNRAVTPKEAGLYPPDIISLKRIYPTKR